MVSIATYLSGRLAGERKAFKLWAETVDKSCHTIISEHGDLLAKIDHYRCTGTWNEDVKDQFVTECFKCLRMALRVADTKLAIDLLSLLRPEFDRQLRRGECKCQHEKEMAALGVGDDQDDRPCRRSSSGKPARASEYGTSRRRTRKNERPLLSAYPTKASSRAARTSACPAR